MYYLNITNKRNQTVFYRKQEIERHKGEEIIAVISNSIKFNFNEWRKFEFPLLSEGFKEIRVQYQNSSIDRLIVEAKKRESFLHHDKYHLDESLKEHNDNIRNILKDEKNITDRMILLHDFAKPTVVQPNPKHPEWNCYYNHENVGAREILSYLSSEDIKDFYDDLIVCSYHMMFINKEFAYKNKKDVIDILNNEGQLDLLEKFSYADNASTIK